MDGAILETILLHRAEVGLDDLVDRVGFVCHAPLIERERLGATRFDTAFRSYEDLDFWFRLGESGLRWTVVNEPLVSYAMRPGSMSRNPAVMLYAAQSAVCNLFERQRARPEPARLMDASIERRDQRLTHFALSYATHAVMLGADVGVEEAMDLLADSRGRVWITPEQAAEKAHHGFTYALARRYDDDLEAEAAVLRPLGDFWRRCEARGWAAPGLASRAPRHLEFIRHEHAMVAGALLDELRGARRITIIGFGRNGAALAKAAQEREVEVVVRDDRFDVGGSPPEGVEVEAMGAPLGAGIPIVISPLDDAALFERFARAERVVRWSRVRQALLEPAMMRSGV